MKKPPLWHISPNQCFKISDATANWLHLNLGMSSFAVALERRWAAARHVVRIHSPPSSNLTLLGSESLCAFPPSPAQRTESRANHELGAFNTGPDLSFLPLPSAGLLPTSCSGRALGTTDR